MMGLHSKHDKKSNQVKLMRLATNFAMSLAFFLVIIKIVAYFITNSLSILSSFIDSSTDLISSFINFLAIKYSLMPADHEHSYGHGKAEPIAGLAQALIIIIMALFLLFNAFQRFGQPVEVIKSLVGIIVMVISLLSTLLLVSFQSFVIRQTNSIVIKADALHYKGDILINLSVIFTLIFVNYYNFLWLDSVLAILISFYLIFNSGLIILSSYNELMDSELPDLERKKILNIVLSHPEILEVHDLRTRSSGIQNFIQMHIVLDSNISLMDAHKISDTVENLILKDYPNTDIIIHQDPSGIIEDHKPVGER